MARISRNANCPCGSGRKYKACCERKDQARREEVRALPRLRDEVNEIEGRLVQRLLRWIKEEIPHDPMMRPPFPTAEVPMWEVALYPWAAFASGSTKSGRTFLDDYLQSDPAISPEERSYLESQQRSWFGLWEALAVQPGRGMRLRDRLTGEEREVIEMSASRTLPVHGHLVARVIDFKGAAFLAGAYSYVLTPRSAERLLTQIRAALHKLLRLPKVRLLRPGDLHDPAASWAILSLTHEVAIAQQNPPPIRLQNTDGEDMILTEDRFVIAAGARATVEAAVRGMLYAEGEDPPGAPEATIVFLRPGNAKNRHWENTVIGRAIFSRDHLTLSTNSIERADRLRTSVEAACGAHLSFLGRTTRKPDPEAMQAASEPPPFQEVPPPEIQALLQEQVELHYGDWPDTPLEDLDGRTPRQAVKTKSGRARVEALLRELAFSSRPRPAWENYDFNRIRRALGLEEV